MEQTLGYVTLVVRDYDEALHYFTAVLGFELIEDTPLGSAKRRPVVPPKLVGRYLLLARAVTSQQVSRIWQPDRGRVFLFCTPMTSGATIVR